MKRHPAERSYTPFKINGWKGLVLQGYETLATVDPWEGLKDHPQVAINHRAAARTVRVETPQGSLYAKLLTPQASGVLDRMKDWLRNRLLGSQVKRVHRVTWKMRRAGLETPVAVLIASRGTGGGVRHLMITTEVRGELVLRVVQRQPPVADLASLLQRVGRLAADLHQAGFEHGDLLPGNMIVADDGRIILLDNDRTFSWRPLPFLGYRKRRNLTQLCARLIHRGGHFRHCRTIIRAYLANTGWSKKKMRIFRAKLMRRIRAEVRRRHRLYGVPDRS